MLDRILLAAALVALPLAAGACSCSAPDPVDGSFPHDFVRRLPANAKGALFLAPPASVSRIADFADEHAAIIKTPQIRLLPAQFNIKDSTGKKHAAQISPLELRADSEIPATSWFRYYAFTSAKAQAGYDAARQKPALATLLAGGQLKDISYTMSDERRLFLIAPKGGFKPGQTYTIKFLSPFSGRDHLSVVHEIAPEAVDTGGTYKLVLDGLPARRMVTYAQGGTCSGDYLSLRQEFHFELPESLKTYREALTYLPEIESQKVPGRFRDTVIQSSLCSEPEPELASNTRGRGAAVVSCETNRTLKLRGWVGFPEIDGKLQLVGPVQAQFGSAKGHACTASEMLNESLRAGDLDNAAYAACHLSNDEGAMQKALSGNAPQWPSLATIASLIKARPVSSACATNLMMGYAAQKNYQSLQAVNMFRAIGGGELADPATRLQGVLDYGKMLDATANNPQATQLLQVQMEAKVQQISSVLDGELPWERTGEVFSVISRMGERGRGAAPALKRWIRPDAIYFSDAIRALEMVAPGDPELPGLLRDILQVKPDDITALIAYSRAAKTRGSKDMLMKLLPYLGSYVGDVAEEVASYRPDLLQAVAPTISAGQVKPVLEVLARKSLSPAKRNELRQLIVATSASKSEKKELLDWLAARP